MTRLRFIGRRVAGFTVSVLTVFTLAFVYVLLMPYNEGALYGESVPASASDTLLIQYLDWLWWFLTIWDDPVMVLIVESAKYTAVYLVPAILLAMLAGTAIRVYTVAADDGRLDRLTDAVTIFLVSIPVFLIAYMLRHWFLPTYFDLLDAFRIYDPTVGPFGVRNLYAAVWPITAMGVYLLAVQLRYAGAILREFADAEFVKTARAKGAGTWRVGRHIFRNTAVPLLSLFFTDLLGMVIVGVFVVEYITHVPGLGDLLIRAVLEQNVALLLALAVLSVIVGVVANFLQDIAYLVYDPRVKMEE